MQQAPSPYLTIPEAAEFLRCSEGTVYNKICARVFVEGTHYFRPRGSRPLFKRDALIQYVEGKSKPAPATLRMAGGYELGSGR